MQKLEHSIEINAPQEKVFDCIVTKDPYEKWTVAFNPSSSFNGEWKEGEKMRFVSKDDKGGVQGMLATIEKVSPSHIAIKHVGMVVDGEDDTESEEAKKWTPAYEEYFMEEKDGATLFTVTMDVADDYKDMFNDMWPKALELLKKVAESR